MPLDASAQKNLLDQLLSQNEGSTSALPPLVEDKNSIAEFFEHLKDMIDRFLRSIFGDAKGADLSGVIRPLIFLVVAVLVIWLVIVLYHAGRRRIFGAGAVTIKDGPQTQGLSRVADLGEALNKALSQGNLALAARLRWKIFLLRTKRNENATPYEVVSGEAGVADWYRLMFKEGGRDIYDGFNKTLNLLEGGP
jgi:hypothetical protein